METGYGIHGYHSHQVFDEAEQRRNMATYYGMISMMDAYIGRILDKVDELGLAEDTLVVFTTDHGHFFGQHGLHFKGGFHYEDVIKVPFIVRYPGKVPAGRKSEALQSLIDLAPTFLSTANLPIPSTMTGIDQSQVWFGEKSAVREHVLCEFRHEPTTIHLKTYVDERYKITIYYNQVYGELFDLKEDPHELQNRWNNPDYASLKSELLLRFAWAELGKEPLPMPRIWHA
jgi:uncharacterized sulfatase